MSTENNTGITWTFESDSYFLRDDEARDICDYERHSLFRTGLNYGRVCIWSGPLDKTLPFFHRAVRQDRFNHGYNDVDPTTVFRDERGQA